MKIRFLLPTILMAFSSAALAADGAYWTNEEGTIYRSGFGKCVRTSIWTPEDALPECGGPARDSKAQTESEAAGSPAATAGPMAAAPVVANADSDNDGVLDNADKCPGSPSDKPVDASGCTIESVVLEHVKFESNSAELKPSSYEDLDKAVAAMKKYDHLKIEIQAHTDSMGDAGYNQSLSEKRAESVRAYMIDQGIAADRMVAMGYGETKPVADNATREGRARNRRVELKIID